MISQGASVCGKLGIPTLDLCPTHASEPHITLIKTYHTASFYILYSPL